MYSASPISITEPPASWFPDWIACWIVRSAMPKARILSGSTTTWYWRTMPPIVATSATPGTVCNSYFRNQSCRLLSCARSLLPLRSTSAYSNIQPTPVASGPSAGFALSGNCPATWLRYSSTLERAQYRSVPSSKMM